MYKKGFTLAEILIALTLIGVIAALTLPGLIGDTQHRDISTSIKKAYNTLNNAYGMIYIDHYNADKWATSQANVHNLLAEQMQTIGYHQNDTYILSSDGISYQYTSISADCTGSATNDPTAATQPENPEDPETPEEDDSQTISNYCGTMTINIKGENNFNDRPGIKTFAFYLTNTGFIPYGGKGTAYTSPSLFVTGQVIYDGDFRYLN